MQTHAQINNKNLAWIVSAIILFAVFLLLFMLPLTAEAGERWDKAKSIIGAISDPGSMFDQILGSMFEGIGKLMFMLSSLFFSMASFLLDMSIAQSLDSNMLKNLTAINSGWGLMRDVCNMFFIFILLYVSFATILQLSNFNWKKILGNLVIVALLINFSLFFTKIIIDVSNIFAMTFYNSMKTEIDGTTYYGPSVILEEGLNLETTFNSIDEQKAVGDNRIELNHMTRGMIWLGGAVFQMIAGFVFLAGAMIFIQRTITFIFLMILSPAGFIGYILPSTRRLSEKWWTNLLHNALVAPVFLFMIYLVCGIIRSGNLVDMNGSDMTALAVAFTGEGSNFTIILHFLVLIGLIWGALMISQEVCGDATASSIRFAGKITGGALAGSAMMGRQTFGRVGRAVSESDLIKRGTDSQSGIIRAGSRMALRGGDAAAKSSWDVRKTRAGDAAIGGTLNAISSTAKTGKIDVGLGEERGKGGLVGMQAATDEKRARGLQNLGNIIARDAEGDPRMIERTVMKEEEIMEKDKKTGKMVATGKMKMVPKKDAKGKVIKEKLSARKAYVDRLEEQAKAPDERSIFKSGYYKPSNFIRGETLRKRQAIKKGIGYAKKGDKETKEALMAERTSMLENQLESAKDTAEKESIVSNIGGNDLINIDPKVISGENVAPHLSARQARRIIEDKRTNLSDQNFKDWQENLEKKLKDTNTVGAEKEKAEGALNYIKGSGLQHTKGGAGYIKKEIKSSASSIITNVSDNELKAQFKEQLQKKINS